MAWSGLLELLRLNVYAHFCVQKKSIVESLTGDIPCSECVVLCSHGLDTACTQSVPEEPQDRMKMGFHVVDLIDGKWQKIEFAVPPANIREYVELGGRTVITLAAEMGETRLREHF